MRGLEIRFLTRPGCHLCDEARPMVSDAAKQLGFTVEEFDIDADDRLTRDYGLRIPVVLGPNDEVIAEGVIDSRQLRKSLKRYGRRRTGSG